MAAETNIFFRKIGLQNFLQAQADGVVGLIGAASSSVSQIIGISAGVFDLPQVSYSSTAELVRRVAAFPI